LSNSPLRRTGGSNRRRRICEWCGGEEGSIRGRKVRFAGAGFSEMVLHTKEP
jgi:hypothetical protein